jgi:hypothetical protein
VGREPRHRPNPIALATFAGLVVSLAGIAVPEINHARRRPDRACDAAGVRHLAARARPGAGEERPLLGAVLLLKNVVKPALVLGLGLRGQGRNEGPAPSALT